MADLSQGCELIHRPSEIAGPSLKFLEQADILDGDDGLVGKGRHEFYLSVGEGLDLGLPNREDPAKGISSEHGYGEDSTEVENLLPVIRKLKPRLGEHVRGVNGSPF